MKLVIIMSYLTFKFINVNIIYNLIFHSVTCDLLATLNAREYNTKLR